MTTPATFGDFLTRARQHLAAAETTPSVTPGRHTQQLAAGLTRLVLVLRRHTRDLAAAARLDPGVQATGMADWERAGLDADYALRSALAVLQQIPRDRATGATFRDAASVSSAASALAAGRDLLQGHFTITPSGARRRDSGWAAAIASPAVSTVLLAEIGEVAGTAAAIARRQQVVRLADARPSEPESMLASAGLWLARCRAATADMPLLPDPRQQQRARDLLHAIPVNTMPERADPQQDTPADPDLCQVVARTAGRVMHASWTASSLHPGSPAISIASWRAIAAAATVTSHHCHLLCASLASHENLTRTARHELEAGADRAAQARQAWVCLARHLQDVTTDTRGYLSPAAAEITDLATWTGRLAYVNPQWTLSTSPGQPARTATDLAPRPSGIPAVIAAIHHATEALTGAAECFVQQAHAADRADRILVPVRSLPERDNYPLPHNFPWPFTVAPAHRACAVLQAGYDAHTAAQETADTLSRAADATNAPSRTLATARAARNQPDPRPRQLHPTTPPDPCDPGPCETALRDHGITTPRLLWHAAALDHTTRQHLADTTARQATLRTTPPPRPRQPAKDREAGD